ncbi:MAG: hypothetical protein U1D55_19315 [Phycisphaerae bacterium]
MERVSRAWSWAEIEAYHDGQLEPTACRELIEDLRGDPQLRRRLADVERVDKLASAAMDFDSIAASEQREVNSLSRQRVVRVFANSCATAAVAAALLLAVGIWWQAGVARIDRGVHQELAPIGPAASAAQLLGDETGVRVVLAVPTKRRSVRDDNSPDATDAVSRRTPDEAAATNAASTELLPALEGALSRQDVDHAARLLAGASPTQREAAYRRMADVIRSARTAAALLDVLPDAEQIEVASQWARQRNVRAVALERLSRFARQPEWKSELSESLQSLLDDPELTPWLRSYRLLDWRRSPRS